MNKIHIGSMASAVDEKNVLWMSNIFFNGLFRIDLGRREISCVGAFAEADLSAEDLHQGIHICGDEIICTPFYDRAVRIFHRDSGAFQAVAIPEEHKPPFSESTRIGQNVFFLSKDGCIWNYNIAAHSLTMDEMSAEYKKFLDKAEGFVSITADDEGFLLLEAGGTLLCRINLVERETELITIDGGPTNLRCVFYGEEKYWFFLNNSQDIVSWERGKADFTVYKCREEKWGKDWGQDSSTYMPYARMVFDGDNIWISNYNALQPVWIDKDKKSVEVLAENPEDFHVIDRILWGPIYPNLHIVGKDIYFVPCYANLLLCFHQETETVQTMELVVAQDEIPYFSEIMQDKMKGKVIREKEELYTLEKFIKSI